MDGLIDVAARMFHVDIVLYKICSRSLRKAFPALGSHAFLASALHIHVLESKVTTPLAANHASCYHTVTLCLPRLAVSRPQEACFEVLDTRRLCAALHLRPLRETGMLQTLVAQSLTQVSVARALCCLMRGEVFVYTLMWSSEGSATPLCHFCPCILDFGICLKLQQG